VLASAEHHFAAALRAMLAPGILVSTGPAAPVTLATSVQVAATRLGLAPPSEDLGDERGAARQFTLHTWPADGQATVFHLPPGDLEVAEVEAPPGSVRRRSDDYFLADGALRFVRPPAGPSVRALLLGPAARGFVERRRSELTVLLTVRAADHLDELVAAALAAALRACVDLPALEASPAEGVRLRLRRPVAALVGVSRGTERLGDSTRSICGIELLVRGELELTVTAGLPGLVDRIARVEPGVSLLP
jgi:hypothetical protein